MLTDRNLNISQYIAEAIELEMAADDRILVFGEDVGRLGGVFGTTRNLQRRFGSDRVRDTPIAEMGFVGMGVGLAMAGYRPIVEIMFVDFIGVCLEQIYNEMAKIPYMSGGRVSVPMVIKTAGGSIGDAAQHSQTLWGLLAHLPGMQVVAPSCPYDYKGLLAGAIRDDAPTVFIEHKAHLLLKAEAFSHGATVPQDAYVVPLGKANVVRRGSDVTVVSLSNCVNLSIEAAVELATDGIEVEVVDLRSLVPLDTETVCESVARTGCVVVVDEDYLRFGMSGEIVAAVVEQLGPQAVRGISRIALPNVPIPAALTLESEVLPSKQAIVSAVRSLAGSQ